MRNASDVQLAVSTSKLNGELLEVFVRLVMAGNYYTAACKAIGISNGTFRRWMALGQASVDDNDIYRQFFLRVQEADAYAETYAVKSWRGQFSRDYRASRDFLARRYPERWGMQQKITLAVDNELQLILKTLESRLPPEVYGQVIVALADSRDSVVEGAEMEDDGLGDPFIDFAQSFGAEREEA